MKFNKVYEIVCLRKNVGIGIAFFPYQLAFGISIRYFERSLMFRIYLGPAKLWGYIKIK